jgi:hypothetical protein
MSKMLIPLPQSGRMAVTVMPLLVAVEIALTTRGTDKHSARRALHRHHLPLVSTIPQRFRCKEIGATSVARRRAVEPDAEVKAAVDAALRNGG